MLKASSLFPEHEISNDSVVFVYVHVVEYIGTSTRIEIVTLHPTALKTGRGLLYMRTSNGQACAILLALAWALRCTPAHAQTCGGDQYIRFKFKGTLNSTNCVTRFNGVYREHDSPAVANGAVVYKLESSTLRAFIWRRATTNYYEISDFNSMMNSDDLRVYTHHRDIRFLTDWAVYCRFQYITYSNNMIVSGDGFECMQCPANSASSDNLPSITACQCNAGFQGPDGGPCGPCAAGKYKTVNGSAACTDCLTDQYSSAVGAASDVCQACGVGEHSFTGTNNINKCCKSDEYKRAILAGVLSESASVCQPGVAGIYARHDNPPVLNGAVVYKLVSISRTVFLWRSGGSNPTYWATPTNPGAAVSTVYFALWTTATNIESLTTWGMWCATKYITYNNIMTTIRHDSECLRCPPHSAATGAQTLISDCQCNTGATGPDGAPCAQCVSGKYKNASGSAACTDCLADQYSTAVGAASNMCERCAANTQSPAGSDDISACSCRPGFTGIDGGACVQCAAGKYKD